MLSEAVIRALPAQGTMTIPKGAKLPLHPSSKRLIRDAIDQAVSLGHDWVGTEHLLLALCVRGDRITDQELMQAGATHWKVREFVLKNVSDSGGEDALGGAGATNSQ